MANAYPNLWNLLLQQAKYYKNKAVITYGKEELYFPELCEKVKKVAAYLQKHTSKKVVGINVVHPFEIMIGIFGVLVSHRAFWITNTNILKSSSSSVLDEVFIFDSACFQSARQENESLQIIEPIEASSPFCWTTSSGSMLSEHTITEHTYYAIIEDTYRQIDAHGISDIDRIDILSSLSFSASLSSIFPSIFSGASLHIKKHSHNIADIYDFWKDQKITMTCIIPSLLRTFLKLPFDLKVLPLRFVCTGGEEVLLDDLKDFRKRFNKKAVLQVALASSETRTIAQLILANTDPFPLNNALPYSPLLGRKLSIVNSDFHESAIGEVGRIAVQSKFIGSRNIDSPESFSLLPNNEYYYISDDYGAKMADGKLYLADRHSRKIKHKGEFIDLDKIEKLVLRHNDIFECYASLKKSNIELHLFIYSLKSKEQLNKWINHQLKKQKYHLHLFGSELPKLHSGKIDRKKIDQISFDDENISSTSNTNEGLLHIVWKKLFPAENNFTGKNFFKDLGGDSIKVIEFTVVASETFKKNFEPNTVYLYPVFEDMLKFVINMPVFSLIQVNKASSSSKNILIFPYPNGAYKLFPPLIELLKEKYNFYVIKYPIEENNTFLSAKNIATKCADFLNSKKIEFLFFVGYSFAGLLSYYTAVYSKIPKTVFLIETPTYQKQNFEFLRNLIIAFKYFFKNIFKLGKIISGYYMLIRKIRNHFQEKGSTKITSTTEMKDYYSNFINTAIAEEQIIPCSDFYLGIFLAAENSFFKTRIAPNYDWDKYNSNVLFKHTLKGNHVSINSEDNMRRIALEFQKHHI